MTSYDIVDLTDERGRGPWERRKGRRGRIEGKMRSARERKRKGGAVKGGEGEKGGDVVERWVKEEDKTRLGGKVGI